MRPERSLLAWVPDRGDVIWIDHNPQAGRATKDPRLQPGGRSGADGPSGIVTSVDNVCVM
jgi:hypothetical protein